MGINDITSQKDFKLFLFKKKISYEIFFEWNLLQLFIENTYSFPNRSHVLC
jgi:hypothetical protein